MKRTVLLVITTVVVWVAFAVAGYALGRRAPRKAWEVERARLDGEIRTLNRECEDLKDQVRQHRTAARKKRQEVQKGYKQPRPPAKASAASKPAR